METLQHHPIHIYYKLGNKIKILAHYTNCKFAAESVLMVSTQNVLFLLWKNKDKRFPKKSDLGPDSHTQGQVFNLFGILHRKLPDKATAAYLPVS